MDYKNNKKENYNPKKEKKITQKGKGAMSTGGGVGIMAWVPVV